MSNNKYDDYDADEIIKNIVTRTETEGQKDPYKAVNPVSGALGKYQFLSPYQKEPIEKKYQIPFEEIVNYPEIQEDYFKTSLLPGYKAAAERRMKEFPEANIEFPILAAVQQLGPTNVKRYLQGKIKNPDLLKQFDRFFKIGNEELSKHKFSKIRSLMDSRLPADSNITKKETGNKR